MLTSEIRRDGKCSDAIVITEQGGKFMAVRIPCSGVPIGPVEIGEEFLGRGDWVLVDGAIAALDRLESSSGCQSERCSGR